MKFDWDPEKAETNLIKHGVSFEEGIEVFGDPMVLDRFDDGHSDTEIRFNSIGMTPNGILFVVFAIYDDEIIWIISVRSATGSEKREYHEK